jgi:ribosomal protein S18 acetylase RimI-like enzyme
LNESEGVADSFARLYTAASLAERLHSVSAADDGRLLSFAYGHRWRWAEQNDEWSTQLRERLGSTANALDGTWVLSLLARHPDVAGTGLGGQVLDAWLAALDGEDVWLQTTDMATPALRLYERFGFTPIGHGPNAPNGRPGLILRRLTTG